MLALSFRRSATRFRLVASACVALAAAAILGGCAGAGAQASPHATTPPAPPVTPGTVVAAAPHVRATSGILIRRDTGQVLWSKRSDLRLPPASCTKIMTALLVLEHFKSGLDRYIKAPADVSKDQKVAIGLRPGDRITVLQALRAMLVKSANDATVTLAVAVDGSESAFVRHMNRRAAQLGLRNTHYLNSRGSDQPGLFSSARDLAVLGRYVWRRYAVFRAIVATKTAAITWPPSHSVTVTSHNRLLDYSWGNGIKTGATHLAGKVLVGSGDYPVSGAAPVPLLVVTMHEPTRDQELADALKLLRWGAARVVASRGAP
jgi:D-alanyl-D-alanine carboxypeptidase